MEPNSILRMYLNLQLSKIQRLGRPNSYWVSWLVMLDNTCLSLLPPSMPLQHLPEVKRTRILQRMVESLRLSLKQCRCLSLDLTPKSPIPISVQEHINMRPLVNNPVKVQVVWDSIPLLLNHLQLDHHRLVVLHIPFHMV